MSYKVDNAIILAAGLSTRFVPMTVEKHKGFINFNGEVLIERQIRQLKEAGIDEIVIVVGYKKEEFEYLKEKYGVTLIFNSEYAERNTHSSVYAAREYLKNSYVCIADNYFKDNPFNAYEDESFYAAVYAEGETHEWCLTLDENDAIKSVNIGGSNQWYMLGHAFFTNGFSKRLLEIIEDEYNEPKTKDAYWEDLYIEHIDELPMKIKRYNDDFLLEFDSLEELRMFDERYVNNSGSPIMEELAKEHNCSEGDIVNILPVKNSDGFVVGMKYSVNGEHFQKNFN